MPLSVTISGVAPYEQAAAHCAAPAWTLYVTVTVAQSQSVVVATRPLVAGQAIGPGDVALKDEPVSLYAGRQVFYDPAQLVGDQAVMSLAAGAILVAQDIAEPVVVKAGQTVTVQVINGGVDHLGQRGGRRDRPHRRHDFADQSEQRPPLLGAGHGERPGRARCNHELFFSKNTI